MRKHIKHFLLLLVLLSLFVACGKEKPKEDNKSDIAKTENTEKMGEVEDKEDESEKIEEVVEKEDPKGDERVEDGTENITIPTNPVVISNNMTLTPTQLTTNKAIFVNGLFDLLSTVVTKDNIYVLLKYHLIALKQDGDKLNLDESKFDKGVLDVYDLELDNIALEPNTDTLYAKGSNQLYVLKDNNLELLADELELGKFNFLNDANNAVISFHHLNLYFYTKNADKWELISKKNPDDIVNFEIKEMLVNDNSEILVVSKKEVEQYLLLLDKNLNTIGTYDNKKLEGTAYPKVSAAKCFILNKNRNLFVIAGIESQGVIFKDDGSHVKSFPFENFFGTVNNTFHPNQLVALDDNSLLVSGVISGKNGRELGFAKIDGFLKK